MPRSPKVVQAAATKKLTRNPKPRGPSRPSPAANTTGMRCEGPDCGRDATVFHRWKWWCQRHDPGDKPDPNCTHFKPSRIHGMLMCAFCGGTIEETHEHPD
jgi:hypothetical protein